MGKIYEALEQAQRERSGVEDPIPFPIPQDSPVMEPVLEMHKEMVLLYQRIDSLLHDSPSKVIQFIAAREGEGTSTIVRQFARTSSIMLGKSVFLFDADKPYSQTDLFVDCTPGDGGENDGAELGAAEKAGPDRDRPEGPVCLISHPSALIRKHFYSPQIEDVWENLRQRFEMVLIDSPPFATSPDGIAISRRVDGVVLVLQAEKTRWPVAENLKDQIRKNGGNILGIVFNKRHFYIPDFLYKWL